MTHCKRKSPTFVSRPHFYLADESYLQQFQYGLRPDPEKHHSVFWLEAMSSIPLKVNIRLQLNILLRKVEGIEYLFRDVQEVMFPVLWFETLSELPQDMAGSLNLLIMLPTVMEFCALFSLIASLLIVIVILACQSLDRQKQKILLRKVQESKEVTRVKQDCVYSKVPTLEQI